MAYIPSDHTAVSKPLGTPKGPTDGRTQFLDKVHFIYRDFANDAECLAYLSTANFKSGHINVFINPTGTIDGTTGLMSGGAPIEFCFRDDAVTLRRKDKYTGSYANLTALQAAFAGTNATTAPATTPEAGLWALVGTTPSKKYTFDGTVWVPATSSDQSLNTTDNVQFNSVNVVGTNRTLLRKSGAGAGSALLVDTVATANQVTQILEIRVENPNGDQNNITFLDAAPVNGAGNTTKNLTIGNPGTLATTADIAAYTYSKTYIDGLASGGASTVNYNFQVRVDKSGNDSTGQVNNFGFPFLTIDAALTALNGPGVVKVGIGAFNSPSNSKLKDGTGIIGSGQGIPNMTMTMGAFGTVSFSAPTKLVGGTIFNGTFNYSFYNNITLDNFSVDVGSDWCTASNSGAATDGLVAAQKYNAGGGQSASDGLHTLQTDYAPRYGCKISNITVLGKDSTSAFHAALFENLYAPDVSNITTFFLMHGVVFKAIGAKVRGIRAWGHQANGFIVKCNDYAHCYNIVASDIIVRSLVTPGDGGGIRLHNANGSKLYNVIISNFKVPDCSFGVLTNIDSGTIENISLSNGQVASSINVHGNFNINNVSSIGVGQTDFTLQGIDSTRLCKVIGCTGVTVVATGAFVKGGDNDFTNITGTIASLDAVAAPTIVSIQAVDANTLVIALNQFANYTDFSGFLPTKNGASLTPTAISGIGTNSFHLTVPAMLSSDVLTLSYTPGNVVNALGIPMAATQAPISVSNIIPSGGTVPSGATAYWSFNESAGDAADGTGNGNTLTNVNGITYVSGKIANAAKFVPASAQYFRRSRLPNISNGFALNLWVKCYSVPSGIFRVAGQSNDTGQAEFLFYLSAAGSVLTPHFILSKDGTYSSAAHKDLVSAVNISANAYHMITIVYLGGGVGTMKLYVDGALDVSNVFTDATNLSSIFAGSTEFRVGTDMGNTSYFDGEVDGMRLYMQSGSTPALTDAQVLQLYNGGAGI